MGVVASVAGIGLSSVGLMAGRIGDGSAALAHSGAGVGMAYGALTEVAVRGSASELPLAGMGYGAMGGWLVASSAAMLFEPSVSTVALVDLGAGLGGLVGASAASLVVR